MQENGAMAIVDESASSAEAPSAAKHPLLLLFRAVDESDAFFYLLAVLVLGNSVLLAMNQQQLSDNNENSFEFSWHIRVTLISLTVFFTFVLAMRAAYRGVLQLFLTSPWDLLDLFINVTALLSFAGADGGVLVSAHHARWLGAFNMLRPFRFLASAPGLVMLTEALHTALPMLVDSLVLICFVVMVFAAVAVNMWSGEIDDRCFITSSEPAIGFPPLLGSNIDSNMSNESFSSVASQLSGNENNSIHFAVPFLLQNQFKPCSKVNPCPANITLGDNYTFPVTCETNINVFYTRYLNYNNLGTGLLLLLKVASFDVWGAELETIMVADGSSNAIFFVVFISAASFFCLKLFVAVVYDSYSKRVEEHTLQQSIMMLDASISKAELTVWKNKNGKLVPRVHAETQVCPSDFPRSSTRDPSLKIETKEMLRPLPLFETLPGQTEGGSDQNADSMPFHRDDASGAKSQQQRRVSFHDALAFSGMLSNSRSPSGDTPLSRPSSHHSALMRQVVEMEVSVDRSYRGLRHSSNEQESAIFSDSAGGPAPSLALQPSSAASASQYQHWSKWPRLCRALESFPFAIFMMIVTFASTLLVCIDSHGIHESTYWNLTYASSACCFVIGLQLVLRCIAYPLADVFRDKRNILDAVICAFSVFEVVAPRHLFTEIPLVKSFRVLRILRLARYIPALHTFRKVLTISKVVTIMLLVLFMTFCFVFAVIGMMIFDRRYALSLAVSTPTASLARETTSTLWESFLLVFITISGDEWTSRMKVALRLGPQEEVLGVTFFVTVFMVGNYVLISLFSAVMISNWSAALREEEVAASQEFPPLLMLASVHRARQQSKQFNSSLSNCSSSSSPSPPKARSNSFRRTPLSPAAASAASSASFFSLSFLGEGRVVRVSEDSFFFFSPTHPLRKGCVTLLNLQAFRIITLAAVFVSCVFLFFESSNNSAETNELLNLANIGSTIYFCVEMAMKMLAYGVVWPAAPDSTINMRNSFISEYAYFRNPWNWVDALVNLLCIFAIYSPPFRVARALRTVRLITDNEQTRVVLVALLKSLPRVLELYAVIFFILIVCAFWGMQVFSGMFYRCTDSSVSVKEFCVGNFSSVVQGPVLAANATLPRMWIRAPFHYDNIGAALLSTFVVAVGDDWSKIMRNGMDVSGRHPPTALTLNASPFYSVYFLMVYTVCYLLATNFILGVLVNHFSKVRRTTEGSALLTERQLNYMKACEAIDEMMFHQDPLPLENPWSRKAHQLLMYRIGNNQKFWAAKYVCQRPLFEYVVLLVVVVNSVAILSTHRDMSSTWRGFGSTVDNFALAFFVLEAGLRLMATGPVTYFREWWNKFDFLVAMLGLFSYMVHMPDRSVIAVRVIKLAKKSRIEKLVRSILNHFQYFANVIAMQVLVVFMYAVAGVILFGNVRPDGVGITETRNFRTTLSAMLVLFQCATRSRWTDVMLACSQDPLVTGCHETGSTADACGGHKSAVAFFVSFMVISVYTLLVLLVAVIAEIFTTNADSRDTLIRAFVEFQGQWTSRFGLGCSHIPAADCLQVLLTLPPGISDFGSQVRGADFLRFLVTLHIPVDCKVRVSYRDVVYAFARRKYHIDFDASLFDVFTHDHASGRSRSSRKHDRDEFPCTIADIHAANTIRSAWKTYKAKCELQQQLLQIGRLVQKPCDAFYCDDGIESSFQGSALRQLRGNVFDTTTAAAAERQLPSSGGAPALRIFAVSEYVPVGAVSIPGSQLFAFEPTIKSVVGVS